LQLLDANRQTGGHAMPAIALEQIAAAAESLEEMDRRDSSGGAPCHISFDSEQHYGPEMTLDDARGDDADHAGVPPLGGKNEASAPVAILHRGDHPLCFLDDCPFDPAALAVLSIKLRGQGTGGGEVTAGEQLNRSSRVGQPPARIQARAEPETETVD